MTTRPGTVGLKALNQYRKRDVIAYLGLRYYLENTAAKHDEWAQRAAVHLVLAKPESAYFASYHFKEARREADIAYRLMHLPAPNEALAETALLHECSSNHQYVNPNNVFSYALCGKGDKFGVFQPYMVGLRNRHQSIAKACRQFPSGVVRHLDIRRFYPSIRADVAEKAWNDHATFASLDPQYVKLGNKLLVSHSAVGSPNGEGVLTGPMFTHLIANLVLRPIDVNLAPRLRSSFFRYVDDIVLVGTEAETREDALVLEAFLGDLGLEIHQDDSPKTLTVHTSEWLEGEHDFSQSSHQSEWMIFIRDLKHFLLRRPTERIELQGAFRSEGLRIPVRDYSTAANEASFSERIASWVESGLFRYRGVPRVGELLQQAFALRSKYEAGLLQTIDETTLKRGFSRKRELPKLRYRSGRLVYLSKPDTLTSLAIALDAIPELHFHSRIMDAVSRRNVDRILPMGVNAAQGAAQPLRAAGVSVTSSLKILGIVEQQSLAVLALNGVDVSQPEFVEASQSELLRFATSGPDISQMKSSDGFISEIACLHGLSSPRHAEMLETAFDKSEEDVIDAVEQIPESLS